MPRKPSGRVSNSLLTSSKQYDEDRPSQDSVTSHSSASSQDTFDLDQTDQFSTSGDSDSVEDDQKQLIRKSQNKSKSGRNETDDQRKRRLERMGRKKQREYVAKCKTKNKIKKYGQHPKNWQKRATRASIEQYYLTEESDDDLENIKTEPSNEESVQLCYNSASTSISDPLDPLMASRPTRTAKVICLQKISETVTEESSGDESPLASYRRYQEHEDAEVHLHHMKEFKKCCPKYGDKARSEKRELSEEKLRKLAIEHVDALRVMCHRINIRQYLPKYRIKESVEQDEQHHSKSSENVVKHELQDEIVEQYEQSLAKAQSLYLTDKEGDSEDADIHPHAFGEIKTELQGYDQICEVTASDSIADLEPNVNDQDNTLGECDPLGGIGGVSLKTESNVLEEEYEVEKCIKMEIDIEHEGLQQIKPREGKNSMAGAIKVRNINELQKPLAKEIEGNINNTTNTVTIRKYTRQKRINTLPPALQQCLEKPRQDVPILKENRNFVHELRQQNIIQQYVPSSRTEKSVEQDPITESRFYISAQEIKSGPSKQEYIQLCKVTASEDIGESEPNVNDDVVYKVNLHDGIASNNIRTEDTVVEEEYDDGIVLKMEIDVESEGVQQTECKENNSLVDHYKVQDIDDTMQKLLEKQEKEDVEATRINRTTENKKYRCYGKLNKRVPNESVEQREQPCTPLSLIHEMKNKAESQRTNKTVEQRVRRPEINRQFYLIKVKDKLSDEQRKKRAEYKRQWYLNRISNESAEEREQRRNRKRAYNLQRIANETVEERKQRLEKRRQYDKIRKANSILEQCEQLGIARDLEILVES